MKKSIISVKIDDNDKKEAQKLAKELGVTLSSVVKASIKEFLRKKEIHVALEPSNYLKEAITEAEEEYQQGKTMSFKSAKEALAYLDEVIAATKKSRKDH